MHAKSTHRLQRRLRRLSSALAHRVPAPAAHSPAHAPAAGEEDKAASNPALPLPRPRVQSSCAASPRSGSPSTALTPRTLPGPGRSGRRSTSVTRPPPPTTSCTRGSSRRGRPGAASTTRAATSPPGATAGDVVIKYTSGEGAVSFVAASANYAVRDVQDWSDPSLKEQLLVFYPAPGGSCRFSDPLALVQVTVFACGGFVLGVTWNHSVADGVGMGQFLQAVGELSRGLPSPSVVPVRQRVSLVLGPPPLFAKFLQLLGRPNGEHDGEHDHIAGA